MPYEDGVGNEWFKVWFHLVCAYRSHTLFKASVGIASTHDIHMHRPCTDVTLVSWMSISAHLMPTGSHNGLTPLRSRLVKQYTAVIGVTVSHALHILSDKDKLHALVPLHAICDTDSSNYACAVVEFPAYHIWQYYA